MGRGFCNCLCDKQASLKPADCEIWQKYRLLQLLDLKRHPKKDTQLESEKLICST